MFLKALRIKKEDEKAAFGTIVKNVQTEIKNEEFHVIDCQILLKVETVEC